MGDDAPVHRSVVPWEGGGAMEIDFLEASAAKKELQALIEGQDEYHWAVAWGDDIDLHTALLDNKAKFRAVSFGIAFSATDPDLVEGLTGVDNAYIVERFPGGTFHPKVYAFRSGKLATAIIGSSNFTKGGLEKNREANILVSGDADEKFFRKLFKFVRKCADSGVSVDAPFAKRYAAKCAANRSIPRPKRDPMDMSDATRAMVNIDFIEMDWPIYAENIRSKKGAQQGDRIKMLRRIRAMFAARASFADLGQAKRKAIAGLREDWGWFGSMKGMGDFAKRIRLNNNALSAAVDSIPVQGEVTRAQYERFCALFEKAFLDGASHKGGVATATRLLAMKRPDTFLCICGPNKLKASSGIGFAHSTLKLENYWERVVEPIRGAAWYNSEKPSGRDGDLWEFRAAMLDVLYYVPQKKKKSS